MNNRWGVMGMPVGMNAWCGCGTSPCFTGRISVSPVSGGGTSKLSGHKRVPGVQQVVGIEGMPTRSQAANGIDVSKASPGKGDGEQCCGAWGRRSRLWIKPLAFLLILKDGFDPVAAGREQAQHDALRQSTGPLQA